MHVCMCVYADMRGRRKRLVRSIWHGHHCYHPTRKKCTEIMLNETKQQQLLSKRAVKGLWFGYSQFVQQVYIIMLMHAETVLIYTLILDRKLKVLSGFFLLVLPVYGSFCVISSPSSVLFISCGRKDRMIECEAWGRDNACHNQLYLSCSLCALLFHECLLWVLQKIDALRMPSLFS